MQVPDLGGKGKDCNHEIDSKENRMMILKRMPAMQHEAKSQEQFIFYLNVDGPMATR